jgi:hypothetical protein
MLEGIPATARRWVSDLAKDAMSAQAKSADFPSRDPLYASSILLNMPPPSQYAFYLASNPSRSISARSLWKVSRAYFA